MHRFTFFFLLCSLLSEVSFAQNVPLQIIRLELTGSGHSYVDETVVYTDSSATLSWDQQYDAEKIFNAVPQPNLSSFIDDTLYTSINAIPPIALQTTIPLSVTTGISGNYTLTATELSNFPTGSDVVLDDSVLNVSQSLFIDDTYTFILNETDPDGRFFLNLFPPSIGVDKYLSDLPEIKLLMGDDQFQFKTSTSWGEIKDVGIYSIHGERIGASIRLSANMCTVKYEGKMASGIYLLTVKASGKELSHKFFVN